MSFFQSLGDKVSGVAHRVGEKVHGAFRKGEKFLDTHGDSISKVADTIGNVAAAGAGVAAASGIGNVGLSEGLAAVAAGAKGVSKGVSLATSAARTGLAVEDTISAVSKGDLKGAMKSGSKAIQRGKQTRAGAKSFRKKK